MRTGRRERLKGFDYRGYHLYFLTFCVHQRRHAFEDSKAVHLVLAQILRAAEREHMAISAYCFIPDHLHVLVEARSADTDARQFIKLAKQFSGFEYQKVFGRRLWQRYVYEHVLRSDDAALGVARYIVENPVRGKLAARVEDYPYSGSMVFTMEQIVQAIQWTPRERRDGST